ncbi:hypothetical protein Tco_0913660 [Tanacetum coccineum]
MDSPSADPPIGRSVRRKQRPFNTIVADPRPTRDLLRPLLKYTCKVIRPYVSLYFSTDHCAPEKKPMTHKSSKDVPKIRSPKTRNVDLEEAKGVPVVDNTKVEELTDLNHKLEDEIVELKKRFEEFEQKYNEVENESKERLKELEESQVKSQDFRRPLKG